MSLVANEMLQDSAIVMTSKNPSLSGSKYSRTRHSAGFNILANLLSPSNEQLNMQGTSSIQTGRANANKSWKKSPKKKKPKTPSKQVVAVNEPSQVAVMITQIGQENRSPGKKPRRDSTRTFRPSNKNTSVNVSPKASKQGNPNRGSFSTTPKGQLVQQPKQNNSANLSTPKRFPLSNQSSFQQNRFIASNLNPMAQSFIPNHGYSNKPGTSNEYVSRQIVDYNQRNRQSNDLFKKKQIMRSSLENSLKNAFPNHSISCRLIGSSTNGIGDNPMSADICILAHKKVVTSAPSVAPLNNLEVASISAISTSNQDESDLQQAQPILVESTEVSTVSETSSEAQVKEEETTKNEDIKLEPALEATEEIPLAESKNEAENKQIVVESEKAIEVAAEEDSNNAEQVCSNVSNEEVQHQVSVELPSSSSIPDLTLDMIAKILEGKNFVENIKLIPAKVPIIKLKDKIGNLEVTLCLNQQVSIRNTQLIRDYAKIDWRFPFLALILKEWARENQMNSAIDHTISNYSWTLMTIHYLQVCDPPVLPSLQKLVPRRYDQHSNIEQTLNNWRRYPTKWRSNNNSNLRQLLKGLFRYYGYTFNYDQHVISIREGKALDRTAVYCPNPDDVHNPWNSFLCIEEPFNRSNTTRSVRDKAQFDRIIEDIKISSNSLRGAHISLYNIIADDIVCPITYLK